MRLKAVQPALGDTGDAATDAHAVGNDTSHGTKPHMPVPQAVDRDGGDGRQHLQVATPDAYAHRILLKGGEQHRTPGRKAPQTGSQFSDRPLVDERQRHPRQGGSRSPPHLICDDLRP